jgi:nitrite reductase (NADH) large subunit
MKRKQLAIIGNGMATGRLLDELLRRDAGRKFEITVFGEEPHGCYNRILLNRVLLGGNADSITLKTSEWYSEHGVRLHSGVRVIQLSPAARRLWTSDGKEQYFDAVVFATGSTPRVPPIEGLTRADGSWKAGVFAYRTIADVNRMRARARPGARAAVIGGGLLGLEAAKGLADLGMMPTIVHIFETLMDKQVDKLGGQFLRRAVEALGIQVQTSATTKAIIGKKAVEAVSFGDGSQLPSEMVVFAAGIRPRIQLAQESDIPTNSGILVDDAMQTRLPGIYAVGECAEHDGQVYGIVQPIYEQCAVLADVLTGSNPNACYRGSKMYTRLKVAGVDVASMGDIEARHATDEVVQVIEERRGVYRKLVIRDGRLAGAVLVGDTSAAPGLIRRFERAEPLPANRLDLLASGRSAIPLGNVCECHQVSELAIQDAIRSGCRTIQQLSNQTGAGTGCGSCRGQLAALLLKSAKLAAIPEGAA